MPLHEPEQTSIVCSVSAEELKDETFCINKGRQKASTCTFRLKEKVNNSDRNASLTFRQQ